VGVILTGRLLRITVVALGIAAACCSSKRKPEGAEPRASSAPRPGGAAPPTFEQLQHYWMVAEADVARPGPSIIAWEAEDANRTDFPSSNPFAPQDEIQAAKLSGHRWIGAENPGKRLFLQYDLQVQVPGSYQLYARKFWKHGPFRWRFDEQPFSFCGRDPMLLDEEPLRQFVGANWVVLGEVKLDRGRHVFRVELTDTSGVAAFDRFMLVDGDYVPRGVGDPTTPIESVPPDWFVFLPGGERFEQSPIDLRYLNADNRRQFERLRADGGRIVRGDPGAVERLWGVNVGHDVLELPDSWIRRYARWLAKLGVNLVRLHGPLFSTSDIRQLDRAKLDNLLRFHSALKREGIYLGLSIYFPLWMQLQPDPEFPGYNGQPPFGLAYFNRRFAEIQAKWWQQLLSLTGDDSTSKLSEDPSIAYVELVNEDSSLFWTMAPYSNIPEAQSHELERMLGAFVAAKYGSIEQALRNWSGSAQRGDEPNAGRVGMMGLFELANRRGLRSRDTAEFLARLMREYYTNQLKNLREAIGYHGLTVCSNWHTADARYLDPLDRWANAVCDVTDHHGYFQGPHRGPSAAYTVSRGDLYDDRSALKLDAQEELPPVLAIGLSGKPSIISELGWPWPNRFRAEYAALAVGYGSLQGTDGIVLFTSSYPGWAPAIQKFTINDPVIIGQFPAAALAFRQGFVRQGEIHAHVALPERELFALKGLPSMEAGRETKGLRRIKDLLLQKAHPADDPGNLDRLGFLVGKVELGFESGEVVPPPDGEPWIQRSARTVTSNTRELRFDYGRGMVTINAPAVNAAAGFFRGGSPVALAAIELALDIEYGSVFLVALDGQPLVSSRRMLLQVVTEAANAGFSAPGAGIRPILEVGRGPVLMRKVSGRVRLKRDDASDFDVTALDAKGQIYRRARHGAAEIPLLPEILYYLIERR
jgi:hypothetical protein